MSTDWEGKPTPENEPLDKVVLAWEVEPHIYSRYDMLVERSWQKMLRYVRDNIEYMLEDCNQEQLQQGEFVLKIRLRKWSIEELPTDDNERGWR